uniref:Chromo domain-containing protein n=1 Tax=Graphocephala atropunctata TaxID=36148 RepID=A0A1B6MN70_9HEMI
MVKSKKNLKKEKVVEDVEVDPKGEDSTETQVEDKASQNEDASTRKRGKAKKEETVSQEDTEDVEDSETKENGEVVPDKKKPAAEKKAKATKRAAAKPAVEPARKSSRTPKPVAKENGEEESYEVDKLVKSRQTKGKMQYLVRWKGYSSRDDTWEDEKDLNCPELLEKFKTDSNTQISTKKRTASKSPVKTPAKKMKTKSPEKDYEVDEVVGVRMKNGKKRV